VKQHPDGEPGRAEAVDGGDDYPGNRDYDFVG
jgi:hypothetical protein